MSAKPILFSGPMVRALLDGRKTQTRRVLKPQPQEDIGLWLAENSPPYAPGDLLWVKETWGAATRPCPVKGWIDGIEYRADVTEDDYLSLYQPAAMPDDFDLDGVRPGWRPSIFMPRWASRLTLRVTDVRVQRLQGISEEDATAEGATPELVPPDGGGCPHVEGFRDLWSSIHGPGAWNANPWVCAVSFEVIQANIAEVAG